MGKPLCDFLRYPVRQLIHSTKHILTPPQTDVIHSTPSQGPLVQVLLASRYLEESQSSSIKFSVTFAGLRAWQATFLVCEPGPQSLSHCLQK